MFNTIASLRNKSRNLLSQTFGSETQQIVSSMLYDDDNEVLTTLDMNRIASLTYGDVVCGEIFDLLEHTVSNPLEFTILSLQKTLVLLNHLATYGSNKAANATWTLLPHLRTLMEYNTVLLTLDNPNSLLARVQSIMGGNVDHGQPVRTASKQVVELLDDVPGWRKLRSEKKDSLDSLVPVGSAEETAFVSEQVKEAMLKEKRQKERAFFRKSNLNSETGGFGSGVSTNYGNGKAVGAAHSMEEMLKMANRDRRRYADNGFTEEEEAYYKHLDTLEKELKQKKEEGESVPVAPPIDLLDMGPDVSANTNSISKSNIIDDPLPFPEANGEPIIIPSQSEQKSSTQTNTASSDIFGLDSFVAAPLTSQNDISSMGNENHGGNGLATDLLGLTTSTITSSTNDLLSGNNGNTNPNMNSLDSLMGGLSVSNSIPEPQKTPVMQLDSSSTFLPSSLSAIPSPLANPPDSMPPPPPSSEPPPPPPSDTLSSTNPFDLISQPTSTQPLPTFSQQPEDDGNSSKNPFEDEASTTSSSFSLMGGTPNIVSPAVFSNDTTSSLLGGGSTSTQNDFVSMGGSGTNTQQQMPMMQNMMNNSMGNNNMGMMMPGMNMNMNMNNLSPEQQQCFQQMMMMNQQMMMQMMQMQNSQTSLSEMSGGSYQQSQQSQQSDQNSGQTKPPSTNPFMD